MPASCRHCRPCVGRAMICRYDDVPKEFGGRVPRVSNRWHVPRPQRAPARLGLRGLGALRMMQRRRLDPCSPDFRVAYQSSPDRHEVGRGGMRMSRGASPITVVGDWGMHPWRKSRSSSLEGQVTLTHFLKLAAATGWIMNGDAVTRLRDEPADPRERRTVWVSNGKVLEPPPRDPRTTSCHRRSHAKPSFESFSTIQMLR
jgi:hypothetical protein